MLFSETSCDDGKNSTEALSNTPCVTNEHLKWSWADRKIEFFLRDLDRENTCARTPVEGEAAQKETEREFFRRFIYLFERQSESQA